MNTRSMIGLMLAFLQIASVQAQMVSTLVQDNNRNFEAIHWHPDGRILAVDYDNGRVYRVAKSGAVQTVVTGFTNLAGGGFDQDGNFYFANIWSGILLRLNSDNSYTQVASGISDPVGVVQSPNPDRLYVAQYSGQQIKSVSRSGAQNLDWGTGGGINGPDALIYLDDDTLLIANYNNSNIHKIDPNGNITPFATVGTGNLGYITKGGDYVYAASIGSRKIYRIDAQGTVEEFAGSGATGYTDGPAESAQFSGPNGICSSPDGDTLLVTDGNRIRMITGISTSIDREQLPLVEAFSLSPNPARGRMQISFIGGLHRHLEWRILNQLGQLQASGALDTIQAGENQFEVSLEALAAGIYTFQLLDGTGQFQKASFVKAE